MTILKVMNLVVHAGEKEALNDIRIALALIWTPRLLQANFSTLMSLTEIKIAAIYSVS
jgi:hypothetical protein